MSGNSAKSFTPGRGAMVTLVLVAMLNCMGGAAVAPALPAISQAFPDSSETLISMIITLPSLAVAISGFFVGAIADAIGKARTLAASLVLFTLAGLSGTALPNVELILIGRFIMGIGMAGIATSSTALVAEYYDAHTRARMFGWQSAANGMSVLLLETTGGFLALAGWRVPFFVYVIGILFIVLVALFIREKTTSSDAASKTADRPESPYEPKHLAGYVLAICLAVSFSSQVISFLVPSKMPYLITSFGGNSAISGLLLGAFGISNILASLIYVRLQRRFPRSVLTVGGFLSLTAGCLFMGSASNTEFVLAGVVLVGLGVGTVMPLFMNWLASKSSSRNSGKNMGMYATACNLGQFACSLMSGAVLAGLGTYQAVFYAGAVFGFAFAVAAVVLHRVIDKG